MPELGEFIFNDFVARIERGKKKNPKNQHSNIFEYQMDDKYSICIYYYWTFLKKKFGMLCEDSISVFCHGKL